VAFFSIIWGLGFSSRDKSLNNSARKSRGKFRAKHEDSKKTSESKNIKYMHSYFFYYVFLPKNL